MSAATQPRTFRADIQGLRAVAVVLVVANHTFLSPSGGFVGVDVFYVISGFLITTLLLREIDQTGTVSIRAFYARRVRRIVPVAFLVLVVTTAAAFVVWSLPRATQVALDSLSAALFVSNWHFTAIGADYLRADGAVSPVQHYWSLSIEEQFYAVWPLLLLLLTFVLTTRRTLAAAVLIGLAASLVVAASLTAADPTPAYFNTFARVWELLGGALIAVIGTAGNRIARPARQALAFAGLAVIIGSAFVVEDNWQVPFPWVAPAVLGSMLIVWAAAPAERTSVLGNPVSQWLGNISYSLYLWHFPVLIFGKSLIGQSAWALVALIAIMLVLSHLSSRFVERPIMSGRRKRRASATSFGPRFIGRDVAVGAAALVAIVALGVTTLNGPGWIRSGAAFADRFIAPQSVVASETEVVEPGQNEKARISDVAEALDASEWPANITNKLAVLDYTKQPTTMLEKAPGCRNLTTAPVRPLVCDLAQGEGKRTMLLGDSVAISWGPTVDYVAEEADWSLSAVGYTNCTLIDVETRNGPDTPGFAESCEERREDMFEMIAEENPDVVFLSAAESVIEYLDMPIDEAGAEWQAGLERTLERLEQVPKVYVLTNPPVSPAPLECANRLVGPTSCQVAASEEFGVKVAAESAATERFKNASLIDTESWFCADGQCPAYVGDHIVKTDSTHLTNDMGEALGPVLLDVLRRDGGP